MEDDKMIEEQEEEEEEESWPDEIPLGKPTAPLSPEKDAANTLKALSALNKDVKEEEEEEEEEEEAEKVITAPINMKKGGKSNALIQKTASKMISKRHMKSNKDPRAGITKPAVRRLARRSGIKRIAGDMYKDVRKHAFDYVSEIVRKADAIMTGKKVKTCTNCIVSHVLNMSGNTIYGYSY